VYGNKYKVMSVDSELVTNAAQYVEDTMRQYEKEGHVLTTSKLAVMAAIKIAVEFYECQRQHDRCKVKLQEIINKLN